MRKLTYSECVSISEGKKKELKKFQKQLEKQFHRGREDAIKGGANDVDPEGAKERAKMVAKRLSMVN